MNALKMTTPPNLANSQALFDSISLLNMDDEALKKGKEFVYEKLLKDKPLEEQIQWYANSADEYEKLCAETLYRFPEILIQELEALKLPHDSKILDVGAGTGLSGKLLHEHGYNNIDALDGCKEMLEHSKEKAVYNKFIVALVVADEELPIPKGTYDVALMCGSASPAHIDVTAYKQIIRVVKPGGIIGWILEDSDTCQMVNTRFHDNFYAKTLEKFVNEKLWVPIDGYNPKRVPNVELKKPGEVYFYKVL